MNKLKIGLLVGLVAVVSAFSASMLTTTQPVARNIAFWASNIAYDSATGGMPGGHVRFTLAADTLKVGDVVYWSGNNKVAKSATLVKYDSLAGVVVGGVRTSMAASVAAADVGTLAGTANQVVIVLRSGRTWVPNDANGALVAGGQIIPSNATAGAVETRTTAIDTFFRVIGKIVIGGNASTTVLAEINVK